MALLTKAAKYDIKDSNIALLGSDIEKRVRQHAGDGEPAWADAGQKPGLEIWRVENFAIVAWPQERYGTFYDGDSYIVLNTYRITDDAPLSFDLHFWLGEETSQDEAGTAAYKTVELDDHLQGLPTQYREVQGQESSRFLSHFPHLVSLHGGISTGFHHVSSPPPAGKRLYKISATSSPGRGRAHLAIREIPSDGLVTLIQGCVYVLDKGEELWQFNTKTSTGQEKFKAAAFVQSMEDQREGRCKVEVYDEGTSGSDAFQSELGASLELDEPALTSGLPPKLFRLRNDDENIPYEPVALQNESLISEEVLLLDDYHNPNHPIIYVWLGSSTGSAERGLALQYAQKYLHEKQANEGNHIRVSVPLVKIVQGREPTEFLAAFG
ncbi:hypothetical protein BJ138DRAFT_1066365 [Hygrophoropsis aurantiaca]|uniref:Uncharacterized protein n=1 Tax=Hygrophoropsis aurantiaca TaxID=72124 RepID=A0ACB8A8L4_9AGAM|nr:hypothetical protein BJ138DRAFT_1066365 [Hygrophoropsis aurantiaca]